ncbi:hypothetical protein [Streptomyces sp. NPDC048442]|uniref:hypothetical protein n=1 Tax=Streptomyces sp. NPDC048442 TaxID=3154823 RepID=UPI0034345FEF
MVLRIGPLVTTTPVTLLLRGEQIAYDDLDLEVVDGQVEDLRPVLAQWLREAADEIENPPDDEDEEVPDDAPA